MGEDVIEDVQKELEGLTDDDLLSWVRTEWANIAELCDKNGLPRPPHW